MANNMAVNGRSGASCEVTNATPIEQERMSIVAQCLFAEVSVLIRLASEGRGFSPAAESRPLLGALAPEAALLQGLKAPSTVLRVAAGLKPRPPGLRIIALINATMR